MLKLSFPWKPAVSFFLGMSERTESIFLPYPSSLLLKGLRGICTLATLGWGYFRIRTWHAQSRSTTTQSFLAPPFNPHVNITFIFTPPLPHTHSPYLSPATSRHKLGWNDTRVTPHGRKPSRRMQNKLAKQTREIFFKWKRKDDLNVVIG